MLVSSDIPRPVILTLLGAYWSANDASGPNQSFRAMATALGGDFEFRLLARDRPFGAAEPAADAGSWADIGFARVRYCPIGWRGAEGLGEVLRETRHDILWLNGFFDREFTIPTVLLRRFGQIPHKPTILSPRGEFAAGALGLKSVQKKTYLALARRAGLLVDIWVHATSERECVDIRNGFPFAKGYLMAPNVRLLVEPSQAASSRRDSVCRLAFIGRITRVKNLLYALEHLGSVKARVHLDIYGPIQDASYWQQCQVLIARLPETVTAAYKGEIPNDEVPAVLSQTDLFFLPTMGENFGHAIFEALSCGVPVLISDATPWRDLERQVAGWDLPLSDPRKFVGAIEAFAVLDEAQRTHLRCGARSMAEGHVKSSDAVRMTRAMLGALIESEGGAIGKARMVAK
jgi:glycosyltransferase involved in cell wall biosynthesis